jgi:hypothetical protein
VELIICVEEVNTVGVVVGIGVVAAMGTREVVGFTKTVEVKAGKGAEVGGTNAKNGIFICP